MPSLWKLFFPAKGTKGLERMLFCPRSHSQPGGNSRISATESLLLSAWYPPPALNLSVVGGARPCSFPDPRAHSRRELAQGTTAPELSGWTAGRLQVTCGAHRAGHSLRMLQHPAPRQVEELVWALSPPISPHAGGPTPAQPTGHLALAGPKCVGLCRRNAASVSPALGGQSFPGILPVGRGRGRHRRGNWTPRVTAQ